MRGRVEPHLKNAKAPYSRIPMRRKVALSDPFLIITLKSQVIEKGSTTPPPSQLSIASSCSNQGGASGGSLFRVEPRSTFQRFHPTCFGG